MRPALFFLLFLLNIFYLIGTAMPLSGSKLKEANRNYIKIHTIKCGNAFIWLVFLFVVVVVISFVCVWSFLLILSYFFLSRDKMFALINKTKEKKTCEFGVAVESQMLCESGHCRRRCSLSSFWLFHHRDINKWPKTGITLGQFDIWHFSLAVIGLYDQNCDAAKHATIKIPKQRR